VAPQFPGFLGYPNGENLFISEEVPEKFRVPQLLHEIIEFTELKDQEGRCAEAIKRELETITDDIRAKYIAYRTIFFANLDEYDAFKAEIRASYQLLQNQWT